MNHQKNRGQIKLPESEVLMERFLCLVIVCGLISIFACSSDSKQSEPTKKKEMGVIEQKQHEIAQDAVKGMKDPIDKAKAVSEGESERLKNIENTK